VEKRRKFPAQKKKHPLKIYRKGRHDRRGGLALHLLGRKKKGGRCNLISKAKISSLDK